MAGSDNSGEEMQTGRTNRAEDHTRIWAQQEQGQDFHGEVIFIAEAARDIEDDDFVRASSKLHGIVGYGVSKGAGVIGLDGSATDQPIPQVSNIGVFGRGETGVQGEGSRGPGVEGIGGNRPFKNQFGVGVVGRGGRQPDDDNKERKPHGPGVIGVGGGRDRELPNDHIIDNVGVFGQGAEAEARTAGGAVHGPRLPGAGVVGRGGLSIPEGSVAPGVVGLAGGAGDGIPALALEGDIGVLGKGAVGVKGEGLAGPGVHGTGSSGQGIGGNRGVIGPGVVGEGGIGFDPADPKVFLHGVGVVGIASGTPLPSFGESLETGVYGAGQNGVKGTGTEGRGGIFKSERAAQLRLIPASRPLQDVEQASFIPTAITISDLQNPGLSKDGRAGDLISIVDDDGLCSLWFCIQDNNGAARWAQVLIGQPFRGKA